MAERFLDERGEEVVTTLKPNYDEIQRRKGAAEQRREEEAPKTFKSVEGESIPFVDPAQQFFVFTLSHSAVPPRSLDPRKPAFRVYGAFPVLEDAVDHAKEVGRLLPDCSVQIGKTHEWVVGGSSLPRLSDADAMRSKRDSVLEHHERARLAAKDEFESNVENMVTGSSSSSSKSKREKEDGEEDDEHENRVEEIRVPEGGKKVGSRVPSGAEVRKQGVVVFSCLEDVCDVPGEEAEFLLKVYRCCEDERQADAFVRNSASSHVLDEDIDVWDTCEWCFPHTLWGEEGGKPRKQVYRDEELDSIMSHHSSSASDVEKFKAEQGVGDYPDIPVI